MEDKKRTDGVYTKINWDPSQKISAFSKLKNYKEINWALLKTY